MQNNKTSHKDEMSVECMVISSDEMNIFPYCTDIIYLNKHNQMGIEFNWNVRIRIDGVITTDKDSFIQMMDALVELARKLEYNRISFADELSDELLEMFRDYGFRETKVHGDSYIHYLDMDLA